VKIELQMTQSAALSQRALEVLPSGIAHDARFRTPAGPYFRSGAGARKTDVDGREYLDFVQGHGALLFGIAPPAISQAVASCAQLGTHLGGNHPGEVEWAELICELVPCAERVRFTASGTEATLLALRLARTVTGRERVIKLEGHFHGWHDYVVAGLDLPYARPSSPGIPGGTTASVEVTTASMVPERLTAGDVAAVILEPNGGTWGTARFAPGEIQAIVDACHAHGTVCIFDEVITGFRAASGGMQEYLNITPDLCTVAKVMAGGLPGGAVAGRAELMEPLTLSASDPEWNRWRHVHHPGTYNGNPLSAAAGIAALTRLRDQGTCAQLNEKGDRLRKLLVERLTGVNTPVAVWGDCSWFHVAPGLAHEPTDLHEFKGLPRELTSGLDRALLERGVDTMSLGGFVGEAHTDEDLIHAADIYGEAFEALAREVNG
jgi:glutamate-1-semialdehyde 2,1-aminomutase